MAKTFLTSINLAGNELQNAVVQNLATLPTGVKGQIAFHTATGVNRLAVHDGTAWNTLEYYRAPGTAAQYWRGDKTLATLNTSVVPEGTNLYYTDARVKAYADTLYLPLTGGTMANTNLVGNLNADLLDGYHSSFFRQTYNATIKKGVWSRILYATPINLFGSFMLTVQYTRSGVVVGNTFLITFGHSGHGQITVLGTHGYTQIGIRLTGDSNNIYVELFDIGVGTVGDIQIAKITLDNINANITTYTDFIDASTVSGSIKSELTTENNRINVDGNTVAFLTDNVASATKLQTSRSFSITGAATASAVNFDGTSNVVLNVTSLSAGSLSGTIPSAVLGNSTMYLGTTALKLNQASGSVVNVTGLNSIQIGSAFLRYDAANNAIYVEGATAGAAINFYATGEVSAYGAGGVGGGTGVTALSALTDVALTSPVSGNVLVYNGTHWENKPQSAIVPDLSAYALKTYVDTAIANLVESAPGTLDTLSELAAALGDDPNFATTVTNQIAGKENAITAGTNSQYWRGDKTWQELNTSVVPESGNLYFTNARVLATPLTGYAVGTNAALAATDTILLAFGKVQGQLNNKLDLTANAVSATKLLNTRAFSIGGTTGLTAAVINFDGTANVALTLSGTLAAANGGTGLTDAKGGFTRKVVGTFTTSATSYVINHGLGTDVIAQVVTAATPFDVVECDIEMTSTTTTTFRFNVAPAANAYRYIIIG